MLPFRFIQSVANPLLTTALAVVLSSAVATADTKPHTTLTDMAVADIGNGNLETAWEYLSALREARSGEVAYDLLLAEVALETQRFEVAQLATRRLAKKANRQPEAKVIAKVGAVYRQLVAVRKQAGRQAAIRNIDLARAGSKVGLNINFNRRVIGLPYVGDVVPWKQSAQPRNRLLADRPDDLDEKIKHAQQLISSGNSKQAYELLLEQEVHGAGEINFDYVLGTAAVESGYANQAIFILLRVINQKPKHAGARIELGRAYYANGDLEDSKKQFDLVLQQNPPEVAKLLAEQHLVVINQRLEAQLTSRTSYIEFRLGFDTNANGATDNNQPYRGISGVSAGLQNLKLNPNSLETESSFGVMNAGTNYSHQFQPRWTVRAGGNVLMRSNPSAHFVDSQTYSAYGLVENRVGSKFANVGIDVSRSFIAGDLSADYFGVNLVVGRSVTKNWDGVFQLRAAKSDFVSTKPGKDSNDLTFSSTFMRSWPGAKQVSFSAGLIAQRIDAEAAKQSKDLLGIQLGFSMLPYRSTLMGVSLVHLNNDYDAPLVGTGEREDRVSVASVAFTRYSDRNPHLKWLLNFDFTYTDSTMALFDSDGAKASVGVRYDFY